MTDKMPDVIYAIPDCDQPVSEVWSKENVWTTSTTYIRQDSINVPDALGEAIKSAKVFGGSSIPTGDGWENRPPMIRCESKADAQRILSAARELQRIKGLK